MFKNISVYPTLFLAGMVVCLSACVPSIIQTRPDLKMPGTFEAGINDTTNSAKLTWREFFQDPYLASLIDSALVNNPELNIVRQEIEISRNEARARKGEYLPFVDVRAGAELEKVGRYTHQGVADGSMEYEPGKEMPEPLPDFLAGVFASWELDVWHKLRNARKSAVLRYLASMEGKNFMITQLVAEVADLYYELLALDNQRLILERNIAIQQNALEAVRLQKAAARTTELAVKKFEAEVFKNRSRQFQIDQMIVEVENRINFLLGRHPRPIIRDASAFLETTPIVVHAGVPSQLLENRPDIRQAELELSAADLDVKAARANFYPSFGISAGLGVEALRPALLVKTPESLLYAAAADLAAPLANRNAIKANYYNANARQTQAVFEYERTLLNATMEVASNLSNVSNLQKSYDLKLQEVQALTESISISNSLFSSARADYMEVLLTQRDALEARFELVEMKKQQMNAMVNIYRALGGGWQ